MVSASLKNGAALLTLFATMCVPVSFGIERARALCAPVFSGTFTMHAKEGAAHPPLLAIGLPSSPVLSYLTLGEIYNICKEKVCEKTSLRKKSAKTSITQRQTGKENQFGFSCVKYKFKVDGAVWAVGEVGLKPQTVHHVPSIAWVSIIDFDKEYEIFDLEAFLHSFH